MTIPRFDERIDNPSEEFNAVTPDQPLPPIASFTFTVGVGGVVTFHDTSTDPDGRIVSRRWDFGDRPVANFIYSFSGLRATFTDTSTDAPPGNVVSWLWRFGDGTTSGSQSPVHDYAAGGTYDVSLTVTDDLGNTSATFHQTISLGATGQPYIIYEGLSGTNVAKQYVLLNMNGSEDAWDANATISRINAIRTAGIRVLGQLVGGAHSNYLTNGVFDPARWKAKMNTYRDTPGVVAAIQKLYADGLFLGFNMVDEPHHSSWGGYFTNNGKLSLDALATYAKSILGNQIPCGISQGGQDDWLADQTYQVVDYAEYQYGEFSCGHDVPTWRDRAKAQALHDGIKHIFSINLLDGGVKVLNCPLDPVDSTGGRGTFGNTLAAPNWNGNCRVTATRYGEIAAALIGHSAGLVGWTYRVDMFEQQAYEDQFAIAKVALAGQPRINLHRGS